MGLHMDSLTNAHTLGSSVQSTRDTQGGIELTSFRAKQLTLSVCVCVGGGELAVPLIVLLT